MMHVVIRRHGVAAQQRDAELDEARAVTFDLVGDGADEGARARAHLLKHLGNAVLADDGEVLLAARSRAASRTPSALESVAAATRMRSPGRWPLRNSFIALRLASRMPRPSIWTNARRQRRKPLANAVECAGDAALHKAAGLAESDAEHPVDFSLPLAQGMLRQQCAGLVARLKVVHAKVGGVGVGHIDRDQRNVGLS